MADTHDTLRDEITRLRNQLADRDAQWERAIESWWSDGLMDMSISAEGHEAVRLIRERLTKE